MFALAFDTYSTFLESTNTTIYDAEVSFPKKELDVIIIGSTGE